MSEYISGNPQEANAPLKSIYDQLYQLRDEYQGESKLETLVHVLTPEQKIFVVAESFTFSRGDTAAHRLFGYVLGTMFNYDDVSKGNLLLYKCLESLTDTQKEAILNKAPREHAKIFQRAYRSKVRLYPEYRDFSPIEYVSRIDLFNQLPTPENKIDFSREEGLETKVITALKRVVESRRDIRRQSTAIALALGMFDESKLRTETPKDRLNKLINDGRTLLGMEPLNMSGG